MNLWKKSIKIIFLACCYPRCNFYNIDFQFTVIIKSLLLTLAARYCFCCLQSVCTMSFLLTSVHFHQHLLDGLSGFLFSISYCGIFSINSNCRTVTGGSNLLTEIENSTSFFFPSLCYFHLMTRNESLTFFIHFCYDSQCFNAAQF